MNNNRLRGATLAASLLAPVVASAAPAAADATDALGLDTVVVTATRYQEVARKVPSIINVLGSDTVLLERQSRTLPEALREIPGVSVQKTGNGQGSPFIRGFTGYKNVLLLDGIRLNNSVFRSGPNQYWATVDLYAFDRLEVQKGAGSVLYGSDAIGGVVNAISTLEGLRGKGWTGRLEHRYADAEDSNTSRVDLGWGGEAFRIRGGVTYKDYGDVDAADIGVQAKTGYRQHDANVRLEYDLGDSTTAILAGQYTKVDDAWRNHRTVYGTPWHGTVIGNDRQLSYDQERQLVYAQLRHRGLGALADNVHASLSYQRQTEDQYRLPSNLRLDLQGFDVNTTGVSLQLDKQTGLGKWVYGFEWYRDEVQTYRVDFNPNGTLRTVYIQGPVGDDAQYDLGGVYVQDTIDLGDRLAVTVGGRYQYASAQSPKVQSPTTGRQIALDDSYQAFVGSARITYAPVKDGPWSLFGGVSQGFRAPNLSDLTRYDIARSGQLETPSLALEPEKYLQYEIGGKLQRGMFSAQAAWFYTDIRNAIAGVPTGVVTNGTAQVIKYNGARGNVQGWELQVAAQLSPRWRAFANGFIVQGSVDSFPVSIGSPVREPLSMLQPTAFSGGLRWEAPGGRFMAEGVLLVTERQDELAPGDIGDTQRIPPGGTPGWTVLNLRGRWQATPSLSLTVGVDNVTDRAYRVHGSGVNEPGRNVIASFSWRP